MKLTEFPGLYEVRQFFPDRSISSIEEAVKGALESAGLGALLKGGDKVAITAGSRGIKNIDRILKTVVEFISSRSCHPFILSAMGSHGGGTVQGQLEILANLGITPERTGAPVLAPDHSRPVPGEGGLTFHVSKLAFEFDKIIVVNRIKPHTSFHGPAESGLQKMVAIGLGGPEGASKIHGHGVEALPSIIPAAAAAVLKHLPVAMGLAILEDSHENTMAIEAVMPGDFTSRELQLLEEARLVMPGIPFDSLDVLVVDEMGKNYSGTGMDTNVIGRLKIQGVPEPVRPKIKRIVVLNLSPRCGGNGYGVGLADFTTRRLVDNINHEAMYLNAMTSTFVMRAMIPMIYPDDMSAIRAAVKSLGGVNPGAVRMVRIKNTLNLEKMLVSESLAEEALKSGRMQISEKLKPMAFDESNNLMPF